MAAIRMVLTVYDDMSRERQGSRSLVQYLVGAVDDGTQLNNYNNEDDKFMNGLSRLVRNSPTTLSHFL
jgi:hypothetical protein